MSEHRVDVVEVFLEKHSNADSLSVVRVGEYTCCVRTADWHDGMLAAYIEPDYCCPDDRDEFRFLGDGGQKIVETEDGRRGYRVRVKRLRGVMSMGLLVQAPTNAKAGDNVLDHFGIFRYEPKIHACTGGESGPSPSGIHPCYSVESAYRYAKEFIDQEDVVATEKIHGANARYCFVPGEGMFCGSRTEWKKESSQNIWWKVLNDTPSIREFCESNPDITLYGELYGQVQDLKYGLSGVKFIVFDLLRSGHWVDNDEARRICGIDWAPVLYRGPWDHDKLFAMADGESVVAATNGCIQIREGIVVKPAVDRSCLSIGRVQAKIVSNKYLERS